MKTFRIAGLLLLWTLMLSACDGNNQERTLFTESRYNLALEDVKNVAEPKGVAPLEPTKNGFAIVPPDEKYYGVKAFIFFPSCDMLTDNEVLQLAEAVGEMPFHMLFRREQSYKMNSKDPHNNREFSKDEWFTFDLAYSLYLGKGERPKQLLTNKPEDGNTIYVEIGSDDSSLSTFFIYPTVELTEENLLQITEVLLKNSTDEWLSAHSIQTTQVQYDQAAIITDDLLNELVPAELRPEASKKMYMMFSGAEYNHHENESWSRRFMNETGYDIDVTISAEDGSFLNWQSFYHGEFVHSYDINAKDSSYTDEDAFKVAEEYIKAITPVISKYGFTEGRIPFGIKSVAKSKAVPDAFSIPIYLEGISDNDVSAELEIRESDLSILGFFIGGNRESIRH